MGSEVFGCYRRLTETGGRMQSAATYRFGRGYCSKADGMDARLVMAVGGRIFRIRFGGDLVVWFAWVVGFGVLVRWSISVLRRSRLRWLSVAAAISMAVNGGDNGVLGRGAGICSSPMLQGQSWWLGLGIWAMFLGRSVGHVGWTSGVSFLSSFSSGLSGFDLF